MFKSVIMKFTEDRRLKEFRSALKSATGVKILQRVIRNRLWEYLRGRLLAIQMVCLNFPFLVILSLR